MPIDPNLIPLIEGIVNEEGLSISETVNRLFSFAISGHHITNGNLLRWDSLMPRPQDAPGLPGAADSHPAASQSARPLPGQRRAQPHYFSTAAGKGFENGRIPLPHLLISQRLSREIEAYRTPSPACRAARQLAAIGKPRRPGQRIRFWFVRGEPGVHAWDLPLAVDTAVLNTERYTTLLLRAASAVLQPMGISELELHQAILDDAWQLPLWINHNTFFCLCFWEVFGR